MKKAITLLMLMLLGYTMMSQVPQGSVCEDPIPVDPVNAPLVNYAINSQNYGNDYSSGMITPSSSYLNGNDIVFQFTMAAKSYIYASIQGIWTGLIFTAACPNATTPAARLAVGGGSNGATLTTFTLDPGTYFMIASTFAPPDFTDMIINFSAVPVPVDPTLTTNPAELFVGWATPGYYTISKNITLSNTGLPDLIIHEGGFSFSGANASDYSVQLTSGATYPLVIPFGQSKAVTVTFNPAAVGNSSANLDITYNNPSTPVKSVPVSGLGYLPLSSFSQNFDGMTPVPTGWLPDGWTKIVQSSSTSAYVDIRTATPFSPPNQLTFASSTDLNAKLYLVSPTATNFNQSRVYFTARMGLSSHTGKVQVGYLTSRTDPATFVSAATVSITGSWALYSVSLGTTGVTFPENAYIAIRYLPEVASRIAVIDNFIYELVPTQPIFNVNQTTFNFGNTTWMYESSTQTCQIYNSGEGTLIINEGEVVVGGSDPGAFSVEYPAGHTWPIQLAFGQAINLTLRFSPTEGRTYNALLNITDNIVKSLNTITLTGVGYDAMINPGFLFDFTGTFPPKDWRRYIGLFGAEPPAKTNETAWNARKFANVASLPDVNSAGINIFGTGRKHWLMSPPVNLGDGSMNYQLEFDLALTAKNTANPANFGTDQKFGVVVSTDGGQTWSTVNVLKWWNSSTPISNTGEHVILNLTGYSGRVMFGFYAESTIAGGDVDLFFRNVEVNPYIPLTQLPLTENFESAAFPPLNWTLYNADNTAPHWEITSAFNHTTGGQKSAFHLKGSEGQPQDGWLVSPFMQIPAQGPILLKFWSYNTDPGNYGKNSVLVSTGSPDPADGEYTEIWAATSVSAGWVQTTVDLTSYTNQTIYVAFRYEGSMAHSWYLDDIQLFVDTSPVIIVSPQSLSKSQVAGVTSQAKLSVTNTGIDNLIYNIEVQYLSGSQGWLSVSPTGGNVQGGGFSLIHTVYFNSTGLTPGTYTANMLVNSNDPDAPVVTIPAQLTVNMPKIVEVTALTNTYEYPVDLSTDGEYVLITAFGGGTSYLWSKTAGLKLITGTGVSVAGVSDGGIVSGSYKDPNLLYNGNPVQVAGMWNPVTSAWTFLGMNPAAPNFFSSSYQAGYGISADGNTNVLMQYITAASYKAAKWTPTGGYEMIGGAYTYGNRPNNINKGGNMIFGWALNPTGSRSPAIWHNGNMTLLAPGSAGEANGASATGNYVTGKVGSQGFLWNIEGGMVLFNNDIEPTWLINPTTVLDNGTIFGFINPTTVPPSNRLAFVRYPDGTQTYFTEYAIQRGLADAYQWTFYSINAVTPDGTKFTGAGINPQGQTVTFLIDFDADIPAITVNPQQISESLEPGAASVQELMITNPGGAELEYNAFVVAEPSQTKSVRASVPEGPISNRHDLDPGIKSTRNYINAGENGTKGTFILNYDGPNANAIGLTAGGSFYVAARFPASMVGVLEGGSVQSVNVFVGALPVRARLKIWGPGTTTTPGELLHDQSFNPNANSWNTIVLSKSVAMTGEDIWIGLNYENEAGVYVAGIDGGTTNMDGNWISDDGVEWEHISDYNIVGNWNIRASVNLPGVTWLDIDPVSGIVEPGTSETMLLDFDATGLNLGIYQANLLFQSNDPANPLLVVPVTLNVINCLEVSFTTGWNSFSSYLVPAAPAVDQVFAPVANNLTIVQNMTEMYWPGQNVNTIGDIDPQTGYAVKVTGDVNLTLCGTPASKQLPLQAGWSYLPVLSECDVVTSDFFAGYLNDVVFVQDLVGTGVYWPAFGVNTLASLNPGKAYKIRMANPATLSFPLCSGKSGFTPVKTINTATTPWGTLTMTPASQVVSFMAGSLAAFREGDMIAAVGDDQKVYGYLEVGNHSQNQVITLFGNDPATAAPTGFAEGQTVYYKLFRKSTGEVLDLQVDYDQTMENTTGNYYSGSFSGITKATVISTDISSQEGIKVTLFPNPATEAFTVRVTGNTNVTVELFDSYSHLIQKEEFSGQTILSTGHLEPGIYYVKIISGHYSVIQKLLIQ